MGRGKLVVSLVAFLAVVAGMWGFIIAKRWTPQLGLDLQGGVSIILAPAPGQTVDLAVLERTVGVIRNRIDQLGVAEPDIAQQGETVQVQLPGLADQEEAEDVIGRTAQLQMRPVLADIPADSPEYGNTPPCTETIEAVPAADEEVVLCERSVADAASDEPGADPEELPRDQWNKLRVAPVALGGDDIANAIAEADPTTGVGWQVALRLNSGGAKKFEDITADLACKDLADPQRRFAIVLDGIVESAPGVSEQVQCNVGITGGDAVITVGGDEDEARELALVLRTGALPIQLDIQESRSVSPTLGRSSLQAGLLAGFAGLVLVCAYLLFLYRGIGLAAIAELVMFGLVTLGLIIILGNTVGFALTLAGIAGVIVSIGIAADSSIIYRERFKDELRAGRTIRTAADKAFSSSFKTNLTGNTVSFLAAVVLYVLAVGPVRGFAFTLGLSTLVDTLLLATFTRSVFALIARSRFARSRFMGLRSNVFEDAPAAEPAGGATR
ncbi:MAG: protein translocase subunit SecD [Nitriliruptorales bacterium]|nr:protein translocase subunit SecD [Nitriliruptorales bacterium]